MVARPVIPWIVSIFLLVWADNSSAVNIERRTWILEQLATPVVQSYTNTDKGIFRSGISVSNYADSLSTQLGVVGDAGPLELAAYGSQRFYGKFTDDGKDFERYSYRLTESVAVELARTYTSRDGHSGRLGVQYIRFPRAETGYIRLGVNMGVFERKDYPWILRLNTHLFLKATKGENNIISTSVEIGQKFRESASGHFRVGGFFGWTYRTRDEIDARADKTYSRFRNEHMVFSMGPWMEYLSPTYALKVMLPWRLWMDKETYRRDFPNGDPSQVVHYPMDVKIPDLTVSFSLFL